MSSSCASQDPIDHYFDRYPVRVFTRRAISGLESSDSSSDAVDVTRHPSVSFESQPATPVHLTYDSSRVALDVLDLLGPIRADDPDQALSNIEGERDRDHVRGAVRPERRQRGEMSLGKKTELLRAEFDRFPGHGRDANRRLRAHG